jgi:hypothetical protein
MMWVSKVTFACAVALTTTAVVVTAHRDPHDEVSAAEWGVKEVRYA